MEKKALLYFLTTLFSIQCFSAVDLIISGGIVPNGMTRGTKYPITIYVQNSGSTSTTISFYVNVSINTTSIYNGSQTYLTDIFVTGGIAAGQTKTLNTTITIPCSYTAGTRYILAGTDATGVIPESNNSNNNFGFSFLNRNLNTPLPNNPTSITQASFQANWQTIPEAQSYTLLVALNNTFTNILPGYNNVNVGDVSSRVVMGLNCNTNYYYRVQAVNSCGSSPAVTSEQIVTTSACSCPTQTTPSASSASNQSQTGFRANWSTASSANGYKLDVSTSSTFSSFISGYNNLDVGNNTLMDVTGLTCNTTYYYRLRAYNSCGNTSTNSSTITTSTTSCTCPTQASPTSNAASNQSQIGFRANWSTANGASGYRLDVSTSSIFSSFVSGYNNLDIGNTTSRDITGLACNTTYYYRLRAYNTCGNTSFNSSTITAATTSCTCPTQASPTSNAASNQSQIGFRANWSTENGASGYRLDVSTSSIFSSFVSGYNNLDIGNTTSRDITGLACNTTYYYRLRAYNSCGNTSTNSSTITTSTTSCTCPTQASPTSNAASNQSQTGFRANWSTASGASGYRLDVSTNNTFSSFVPGYNSLDAGNTTSMDATGLTCNTTYYYRIKAYNSCGNTSTNSLNITVSTNQCSNDPSLAVPQQITSPVGNPIGHGCECIKQSIFCQSQPNAPNYGWGFWQRGTCHGTGHSESSGIGGADDRYAWDCNMNLPYYNLDYQQNVYAVADGYIMNNSDNPGWGNNPTGQLLIRHTNGTETWYSGYLHMNQITSKKFGATLADRHVTAGEIIGVVDGVTGYLPHLHFILYYKDPNVATKLRSVNRTISPRLVPASDFRLTAIGSTITGASIFIKRDSVWRNYGKTDENGSIRILLMPSIQQGDSAKILAAGYEEMIFKIDAFNSLTNKLVIPMMEQLTPSLKVKDPKIEVLSQNTFYDHPAVNLKITGKNYSNYDVMRIFDGGDTTVYFPIISNNSPQDSLLNINLVDTGYNYYEFRFKGIDTISLFKSFNFEPNTSAFYKTKVNFPSKLKGAHLYIDGSFIKNLSNSGDSIAFLNGPHYLRIQASGYKDSTFVVNTPGAINISLDSISYSATQSSAIVDFTTGEKIQYRNNVTLMDSSRSTIVSLMQTEDIFSGLRLIPKSRKFEIQRINERWSNIRLMAALDQIDNFSGQDVYLLNINDGNRFKKIAFSNSNAKYDSTTQKLSYNYFNFQNGNSKKEAIAIMKKQPPIITENPGTTILVNDTLILPLSLFVSDPDNLKNDLAITINNISVLNSQFQFTIIDSNVHIESGSNFTGDVLINITATHDFATITKTIKLKVAAPKSGDILSIYPNPGSNTVIADLLLTGNQTYTLSMYDMQGRLIKTFFNNKTISRGHYTETLAITEIPSGTYVFKLNDLEGVKFIKVTTQ
jgi:phosphodiesterase/alkaline phosphatase D-like protein